MTANNNHVLAMVRVPDNLPTPHCNYFPAGNWIGAVILQGLLENSLRENEVLFDELCVGGELNHLIIWFTAADPIKAVKVVCATIEGLGALHFFLSIGIRDDETSQTTDCYTGQLTTPISYLDKEGFFETAIAAARKQIKERLENLKKLTGGNGNG